MKGAEGGRRPCMFNLRPSRPARQPRRTSRQAATHRRARRLTGLGPRCGHLINPQKTRFTDRPRTYRQKCRHTQAPHDTLDNSYFS